MRTLSVDYKESVPVAIGIGCPRHFKFNMIIENVIWRNVVETLRRKWVH